MNYYAIRTGNIVNDVSSGKPDGAFLRRDDLQYLTDNKASARLFDNYEEACRVAKECAEKSTCPVKIDWFVVEVETKQIMTTVVKSLCSF